MWSNPLKRKLSIVTIPTFELKDATLLRRNNTFRKQTNIRFIVNFELVKDKGNQNLEVPIWNI